MRNITMILIFLCYNVGAQIRTREVTVEERSNFRVESPTIFKDNVSVNFTLEAVNNSSRNALYVGPTQYHSVSGKYYAQMARFVLNNTYNLPADVNDTGYKMAVDVAAHLNNGNFLGTLNHQIGIRLHHGAHTSSGPGTITNVVGLHLIGLKNGQANLVNRWSLFQTNPEFSNYFQGKMRLGGSSSMSTPPTEQLEIDGNIKMTKSDNKIYWDWPSRTIEQYSPGGSSRMIRFRNSMDSSNPEGGFDFATHTGESVLRIVNKKVGIGNATPNFELDINGSINATGVMICNNFNVPDNQGYTWGNTRTAIFGNNSLNFIYFRTDAVERMRIHSNGNVGIGTNNPTHKLHVAGQIRATSPYWADFVFEDDYELPSLDKVETYIAENGHLEDIPSEAEVMEKGVNLTEMDAKLLQKIEELTLYVIEQNKQNQKQQAEILKLQKELVSLKSEIAEGK